MGVHYSDWASQPYVRVACTQKVGEPWCIRKDLPEQVYEIPVEGKDSILYTFEVSCVTCLECLDLITQKGWV